MTNTVLEGPEWDRKDLGTYWLKGMVKGRTITQDGTKDGLGRARMVQRRTMA
jgi:hypothetical protein